MSHRTYSTTADGSEHFYGEQRGKVVLFTAAQVNSILASPLAPIRQAGDAVPLSASNADEVYGLQHGKTVEFTAAALAQSLSLAGSIAPGTRGLRGVAVATSVTGDETIYGMQGGKVLEFGAAQTSLIANGGVPTIPSAPSVIVTSGNTQNSVAWTDGSNGGTAITAHKVYGSTTSGFTPGGGNLLYSGAAASPYVHTGLTNGTTWYYKVVATNSVGDSAASTQQAGTPSAAATAPAAPTLAVTAGNAQNSIAWTDGSNGGSAITARKLYRSTSSGFTPGPGNLIVTSPTFPYADTGLTNGTTYYYKGIATNAIGDSTASTEQSGVPADAGAVPSTGPIPLADVTTGVGSSSFGGTGTTNAIYTYNNQAKAAVTDATKVFIGGGNGADTAGISSGVSSLTSDQKAGHIIVSWLGNDTVTGEDASIITSIDGALASLPNLDRFWFLNKFMGQSEGPGGNAWNTKNVVNRRYEALYPANYIDWSYQMAKMPPLTSPDTVNQGLQILQPSYAAAGGTDVKHQSDLGYTTSFPIVFDPWLRGLANEIPFVADGRRVFSNVSTANTVAGFVADMPVLHSLAGCTLSTTSTDFVFAVQSDKVIRITRASATVSKKAYDLVPLTITKTVAGQAEYRTINLRISIGALNTVPAKVKYGYAAAKRALDPKPYSVSDGQKISFVIGVRMTDPSLDTATFGLVGGTSTPGINFIRSNTGGIATFRVRDATATTTTIATAAAASGSLLSSMAFTWFFCEADLSLGGSSYCRMYKEETLTTGTATGGSTMGLAYGTPLMGGGNGISNICSSPTYPTEIVGPFIYADIIGVTDPIVGATRRALFRNPASPGTPLDLGASCIVNGITPFIAMRGNAADLYQGAAGTDGWTAKNFGTGGDLLCQHVPAFLLETV